MKNISKLLTLFLFTAVLLVSCDDNDDTTPKTNTIVDVAIENNLTKLVAAVTRAGLVETLSAPGTYTVFAPSDLAFDTFLRNAGYSSVNDVPVSDLRNILLYHVLGAEVSSSSLSDTYVNTLATNAPNDEPLSLQVNVTGGVTFDGNAAPVAVDVMASNGIVHVIDAVMVPNNVVEFALNNDNFSRLVQALTDSRHTTDFVEILTGNGPFTVFAPTNLAFKNLLDSNDDWDTLGDIPIETLDAVLKYHVVNGANVQADQLVDGAMIETFQGTDITIDLTTGAQIKTSTQTVNILVGAATNDVQGTNGVIHAIDAVLLP
jgi:transforming growth factor-beta-induced protein